MAPIQWNVNQQQEQHSRLLLQPFVFPSDPVRDSFVVPRLPGHAINIANVPLCIIKPKPRPKKLQSICFGWGRHKLGGLLAIIGKKNRARKKNTQVISMYISTWMCICVWVHMCMPKAAPIRCGKTQGCHACLGNNESSGCKTFQQCGLQIRAGYL